MKIANREQKPLSYKEIRQIVIANGISSIDEYNTNWRRLGIPYFTNIRHMPEFTNARDFFCVHGVLDYPTIRQIVTTNNITSIRQYDQQAKELDLPSYKTVKKMPGFTSAHEFFGTQKPLSVEEIRQIVIDNNITSLNEYEEKREALGLPSHSALTERRGWKSWYEFLHGQEKEILLYSEIQKIAKENGITTSKQYIHNSARLGLPSYQSLKKRMEWVDWDTFFDRTPPTLEKYQTIAIEAGIKTSREYKSRAKELGLPTQKTIANMPGWTNWNDFLKKANNK